MNKAVIVSFSYSFLNLFERNGSEILSFIFIIDNPCPREGKSGIAQRADSEEITELPHEFSSLHLYY